MKEHGPDTICWDCAKGRHSLCTGTIPDDDSETNERGKLCECPICHGNRYAERQPAWDADKEIYYDPGAWSEPRRES